MSTAQILVDGPKGAGKTTFIQHLLLSNRSRRIGATRIGGSGGDLARLRDAGAADTALLLKRPRSLEMALGGEFHGVVHEVCGSVNLSADHRVFVTRPIEGVVGKCPLDPGDMAESLFENPREVPIYRIAKTAQVLERLEYWHRFRPGYEGIGPAKSIVINVEDEADRLAAELMAADIRMAESRTSSLIHAEALVRQWPKKRNLYIVDLLDRRDPELKKALATVKRKMPAVKRRATRPKARQVVQLKIFLNGPVPHVWRRVLAESRLTFEELHRIVQSAMGWQNCHLHYFETEDGERFGNVPRDAGTGVVSGERRQAGPFLKPGRAFKYVYDLGDRWSHLIEVEAIHEGHPSEAYPMCTGGSGHCPPEDVGGPPGFEYFKEVMSDPAHEEHEEMREWYGGDFHPADFRPDEVVWLG